MRKHKYREKQWSEEGYFFDLLYQEIILDSSMVERTAVNRDVVGSSPTRGVFLSTLINNIWLRGQAVKTSPFHGGNTGSIPVGVTWVKTHGL